MPAFLFEGNPIEAEDGETVLSALLRGEFDVENRCRVGACQACLLRSNDPVPRTAQSGLHESLVEQGAFLSCQAKASEVQSAERLGQEWAPRFEATVSSLVWATPDVILVEFDVPDWIAAPGRFVHLRHESGVSRPYSLAAPAWGPSSTVRFHVRYIAGGEMSELLAGTKPGERFEIEGPFGKCYYRSKTGEEPIVLIGSGTGLAPLYGILTDALFKGHTGLIHLYHGAATSSRLYFREELAEVARANPNVRYVPTAEAYVESGDRVGSPLKWALSEHPDMEGSRVYLCGHPELVRIGQKQCFLAGANLADISADPFVPA